jgi:hypothetical protein
VRTTTVCKVLEARWPAPLLLPLFTALAEVELSHKERHVIYSKVEEGLKGGGDSGCRKKEKKSSSEFYVANVVNFM